MADLIKEFADYDEFAREWHSHTLTDREVTLEKARDRSLINEQDTRQLWQLLGLIDDDSVFIQLPKWLVKEKASGEPENPPTTFVGHISRESEDAILFEDSSPGRRLMQIAHKIHSLERGIENTSPDSDRHEQLNERLQEEYERFEDQDDVPYLSDEWLPKSQLITIVRRIG